MAQLYYLLAFGLAGSVVAFDPVGDMSAPNETLEDSELHHAAALPNMEAAASRAEALQHAVEHSAADSAAVSARLAWVASRAEAAVAGRRQQLTDEITALLTREASLEARGESVSVDVLQRVNGELDEVDYEQMQVLRQGLHEEQRAARHEHRSADSRARHLARAARRAGDVFAFSRYSGSNASARAEALELRADEAAYATSQRSVELVRLVEDHCDSLERSVQDQLQQARRERMNTQRINRQEALAGLAQSQGAMPLVMFVAGVAASAAFLAVAVRWQRRSVSGSMQESLLLH